MLRRAADPNIPVARIPALELASPTRDADASLLSRLASRHDDAPTEPGPRSAGSVVAGEAVGALRPVAQRARDQGASAVETPPHHIQGAVEARLGRPLGGVSVHRGPVATAMTTQVGADALTQGEAVVIPAEHGPLERGRGASLLVHELIHVAQRRALGHVPMEDTRVGVVLERQARAVQRAWDVGELARPRPRADDGSPAMASHPTYANDADVPLAVAEWTAPRLLGSSLGGAEAPPEIQRAASSAEPTVPQPAAAGGHDDRSLQELADRLYERIRCRLRTELLLDRERSGRLVGAGR